MIQDKTKKLQDREDFIKKYKAALAAGLSKEQLSTYLGVKPDSIVRRRLAIKEYIGLDLPYLKSDGNYNLDDEKSKKFSTQLGKLTKEENKESTFDKNDLSNYKRFVITSAQNATPVHEGYLATLLNYCKVNNARLIIIPYRYKNPTSVFEDSDMDYWNDKLVPYLMDQDIRLNKNLRIMGNIKIQPTAIQPLYGFESYTGSDSAIFGCAKIQLKCVPTPANTLPKILTTTGSITLPNYTDSRAGWRAIFHHSFAATIVELDDDIFHLRHIHGDKETGHFYDLDKFYTSTTVSNYEGISALVTGDSHALFIDPEVEKATYSDKDSIVNVLKPKSLIIHDVHDSYSCSPHHFKDITKYGKHHFDRNNVEKELQITANFIDRVSKEGMTTYIVKSNHDEHFDRWLQDVEPKLDQENARFYYYMKYHQCCSIQPTNTGFKSIDPFEFWCKNPERESGLKKHHLVKFLQRDESLVINNIEMGFHGDRGANGAKGSVLAFAKAGPKFIIGHGHSPSIYEGAIMVGTSSYLNLEYKSGLDSWLHTHCVVYPDGKKTILSIIKKKWRLK